MLRKVLSLLLATAVLLGGVAPTFASAPDSIVKPGVNKVEDGKKKHKGKKKHHKKHHKKHGKKKGGKKSA
jgi:hypothetical protein